MKISVKLGLWIFISMLIIESCLMFFLHKNIVHLRVEQELTALMARGNSHRNVLEKSYDASTLHHIGVMEAQTDTIVVITNNNNVIESSARMDSSILKVISRKIEDISKKGMVLEEDWQKEKYIATVTQYYIDEKNQGHVYMFKDTAQVKKLITSLNEHFLLSSVLLFGFLIMIVALLSRALTKPLLNMKEATKKISKGDFSVSLPSSSNDELGELSYSIQKLANDLNHLKQERNEFLANISHELRTPLTYIKGYADISRKKHTNEEDKEKYLEIIYEETERLTHLVKELFDLAKIDQNNFSIHTEKVILDEFLKAISDKMSPAFKNKGIQLILKCEKNLFIEVDPIRFEQVIMNLLDNALKYSNPNTVTEIIGKKLKGSIHIWIKDQGQGIPKEDLPYIFDRLFRVDKSRSRATGGMGLGLSIVKEIVEAHEGQIQVESTFRKGTSFEIILKELPK